MSKYGLACSSSTVCVIRDVEVSIAPFRHSKSDSWARSLLRSRQLSRPDARDDAARARWLSQPTFKGLGHSESLAKTDTKTPGGKS